MTRDQGTCRSDSVGFRLLPGIVLVFLVTVLLVMPLSNSAKAGKAFDVDEATGQELLFFLDHPDWRFRLDSVDEVARRKLIQAADKLVVIAGGDERSRVRKAALNALRAVDSSWWLPTAERMAEEDSEESLRKLALKAIEDAVETGPRSAAVLGRVLTADKEAGVRRKAAVIIGKKKWSAAEAALVTAALDDPDEGVRKEALKSLLKVGTEASRPSLHLLMLEEADKKVRLSVVERIERSPLPIDRNALVEALGDMSSDVARHAARALVRLGDASVAEVLRQKARETTDPKVSQEFNEAAARLGG